MIKDLLLITGFTAAVTGTQVGTRELCKKKLYKKDMSRKDRKKADFTTNVIATAATVGVGFVGMGITAAVSPSDTSVIIVEEAPVE